MIAVAAVLALAAAQPDPPSDSARTLAAVQNMYEQSCQVRAYGSYDDLCNQLRKQMKAAEKAFRKTESEARARARDTKAAPPPADPPPPQQALARQF